MSCRMTICTIKNMNGRLDKQDTDHRHRIVEHFRQTLAKLASAPIPASSVNK